MSSPVSTCPFLKVSCKYNVKDSTWSNSHRPPTSPHPAGLRWLLGGLTNPVPADLPQVVRRLTNGHVSKQKALLLQKMQIALAKQPYWSQKGRGKLPSQNIYEPIFILKSSRAINYYAIHLVESKWLSCLNVYKRIPLEWYLSDTGQTSCIIYIHSLNH